MLTNKLKFYKNETIHFVLLSTRIEYSFTEGKEVQIYEAHALRSTGNKIQSGTIGLVKFTPDEYKELLTELADQKIIYKFLS